MEDPRTRTAAALIIGNELLSGKVSEQNLLFLSRTLRVLGIALRRVVLIPDERALIVDELRIVAPQLILGMTMVRLGPLHRLALPFVLHPVKDERGY